MVELVRKSSRVSSTDKVFKIFFFQSDSKRGWAIICINCDRICDLHQATALKCLYFWNVFCRTEHWARRWVSAVTLAPLCPFKAILHWSFHNYEKRIGRKKTIFLLGSCIDGFYFALAIWTFVSTFTLWTHRQWVNYSLAVTPYPWTDIWPLWPNRLYIFRVTTLTKAFASMKHVCLPLVSLRWRT